MAMINPHTSIITLSIHGLNSPIKKTQSSRLDQKMKSNHMVSSEDIYKLQRQRWTQSERVENDSSSK